MPRKDIPSLHKPSLEALERKDPVSASKAMLTAIAHRRLDILQRKTRPSTTSGFTLALAGIPGILTKFFFRSTD